MNNNQIMNKINILIKNHFTDYKGLYLYGSKAKMLDSTSSDYDVILLTNNKINTEIKSLIYKIIGRIEYELDIFIDIQVLTQDEISKNIFFYEEVLKHGEFYAAWEKRDYIKLY